jgi:hypothetical protein
MHVHTKGECVANRPREAAEGEDGLASIVAQVRAAAAAVAWVRVAGGVLGVSCVLTPHVLCAAEIMAIFVSTGRGSKVFLARLAVFPRGAPPAVLLARSRGVRIVADAAAHVGDDFDKDGRGDGVRALREPRAEGVVEQIPRVLAFQRCARRRQVRIHNLQCVCVCACVCRCTWIACLALRCVCAVRHHHPGTPAPQPHRTLAAQCGCARRLAAPVPARTAHWQAPCPSRVHRSCT